MSYVCINSCVSLHRRRPSPMSISFLSPLNKTPSTYTHTHIWALEPSKRGSSSIICSCPPRRPPNQLVVIYRTVTTQKYTYITTYCIVSCSPGSMFEQRLYPSYWRGAERGLRRTLGQQRQHHGCRYEH